jgi:hypothetical protein
MSTSAPELIADTNISYAWLAAFRLAVERNDKSITPLVLSLSGFLEDSPAEDTCLRRTLDAELLKRGKYSTAITASTIFPYRSWIRNGCPPRDRFFDWYLKELLPRLKARDVRNRSGTYFERMIAFTGIRGRGAATKAVSKNQLNHIIKDWHRRRARPRRPRQSALQVSCFDPAKDHTGQAVRGFPCLQQISFTYDDDGGLAVNAYYPTQYIFDRAYGNYLGLSHLGQFMAHELRLRLVRMNCYIARPLLGELSKGAGRKLAVMWEGRGRAEEPSDTGSEN